MKKKLFILAAVILIALYAMTNSLGLNEASLSFVASHAQQIEDFIARHFMLSLLMYCGIYIILLCLGMPMGAILAMISGYFYDLTTGVCATLAAALIAAVVTFFLGKTILYRYLHKKYGVKVDRVEKAVNENGTFYVLAVRVSSVLPFFWVNLLFGAANLSYKQYVLPTFIGLIPGTIVYVNMGVSLSSLNSLNDIFSLKIALSFLLLGVLVLLPVLGKKIQKKIKR
ncbi:MAG: TVP38/TMEM64 family protein [Campylobacterota bacterium]